MLRKVLMIIVGSAGIAGGVLVRRARRRALGGAPMPAEPPRGISDVDPGPLVSPLEGIDRDAVAEAHRSIPDQRAKLPI